MSDVMKSELLQEIAKMTMPSPCPCKTGKPCRPQCTCACEIMSGGCRKCARYGSDEQRVAKAKHLIAEIKRRADAYPKLVEMLRTCIDHLEASDPPEGGATAETTAKAKLLLGG